MLEDAPEAAETAAQSTETPLHGDGIELEPGSVLIPKAEALEQKGINGDILALIGLPAGLDGRLVKELALIDFGNEFESNPRVPTTVVKGQDFGHIMGYVRSRYGLMAFNYKPDDHLGSYVPLLEPETVVGREINHVDHLLGLKDGSIGVDSISRRHFTVAIEGDQVTVIDHSTNGTKVKAVGAKLLPRLPTS